MTNLNGCFEKTCANAATDLGLGSYAHIDCENWMSTCTVSSDSSGCQVKTCSNAAAYLNLGSGYSNSDCTGWMSTCTVTSDYSGC